jgi:glutamate/aspartate transport system permease protein
MFTDFDFSVIFASFPYIWRGLVYSAQLTFVATCGGLVIGIFLALARLSSIAPLSFLAKWYVDLMRSIPLLMVIVWFFIGIPLITGRAIGAEKSAFITFTAFEAAYFSEIIRAGIQSISRGQLYAAQALGMTYAQTMGLVILPQAVRNMLPLLLTQTIILFQDTSLVYAIGAWDLLKGADVAGKNYNRPVEMYLYVAVIYFVICFTLSSIVKRLQQKVAVVR